MSVASNMLLFQVAAMNTTRFKGGGSAPRKPKEKQKGMDSPDILCIAVSLGVVALGAIIGYIAS